MSVISCPECKVNLSIPTESVGRKIRCPKCKLVFLNQINTNESNQIFDDEKSTNKVHDKDIQLDAGETIRTITTSSYPPNIPRVRTNQRNSTNPTTGQSVPPPVPPTTTKLNEISPFKTIANNAAAIRYAIVPLAVVLLICFIGLLSRVGKNSEKEKPPIIADNGLAKDDPNLKVKIPKIIVAPENEPPINTEKTADGFKPSAGYDWFDKNNTKDLRVKWVPGTRMPNHPNVVASKIERKWEPIDGYQFANKVNGDWTVILVPKSPVVSDIDERMLRAALKALGAFAIQAAINEEDPPGTTEFQAIVRAGAREVAKVGRDELLLSALDEIPGIRQVEKQAVLNLAVLALDGRLDPNFDSVLSQVKTINPDLSKAIYISKFLVALAKLSINNRR